MFWINCVAAQILRDQYGFSVAYFGKTEPLTSGYAYDVDFAMRHISPRNKEFKYSRIQVSHKEVLEMCLLPTAGAVVAYLNSIRPSDDKLTVGA